MSSYMISGHSKWKKSNKYTKDTGCSKTGTEVTRAGCDYSDHCIGDDGSHGIIDFSITNNSSNLELTDGKKRTKKKRLSCKKLSLISKGKPSRYTNNDDGVDSKLKRVCSQTKRVLSLIHI